MSLVTDFFGNSTYDQEAIRVMSEAYECALKELHDRGQPQLVREVIAKRIVELAAIGEREPQRLCDIVLGEFGLTRR